MRLIRSGIYEYDNAKERKMAACIGCGCEIYAGKNRKRCLPCSEDAFKKRNPAIQKRYRERKKAKALVTE